MAADVITGTPAPVTPEEIYEKAKDVHVRKYVMYGHTDNKLYATADHQTVVADAEDVFSAALYGTLVIFDGTNYLAVVSFTETEFKTVDGATTAAGKTWTVATEPAGEL